MDKTVVEKLSLQKYNQIAVLNLPDDLNYLADLIDYDTELAKSSYEQFERNQGSFFMLV